MAGGGQGPSASTGLVNRTKINVFVLKIGHFSRSELDDGQWVKEDVGKRLPNDHVISVPACPLQEQTLHIGPILWPLIHAALFFGHLEHNIESEYQIYQIILNKLLMIGSQSLKEKLEKCASNSKPSKSIGMWYFLAKFWATPVRKD